MAGIAANTSGEFNLSKVSRLFSDGIFYVHILNRPGVVLNR